MENKITTGTSYFVSKEAAVRYYGSLADVKFKLDHGEIHIGVPELKVGDVLGLCDEGKRYTITR